jgi:hypothetical protein
MKNKAYRLKRNIFALKKFAKSGKIPENAEEKIDFYKTIWDLIANTTLGNIPLHKDALKKLHPYRKFFLHCTKTRKNKKKCFKNIEKYLPVARILTKNIIDQL